MLPDVPITEEEAQLVADATAAPTRPTREQVRAAIKVGWFHEGNTVDCIDVSTDAVMALLAGKGTAPLTRPSEIVISALSDDVHDAILDALTPWLTDDGTDVQEGLADATQQVHRAVMALLSRSAAEPADRGEIVELFRKALMVAHAADWDMETVSEAAHVCAEEVTSWPR